MAGGRGRPAGSGHLCIDAARDEAGQTATHTVHKPVYMRSEVTSLSHSYPFRFITPENCSSSPCRWVYPLTYGGGLVGGDAVTASVAIGDRCACLVTSQESTKVYHCLNGCTTTQHQTYTVGDQALLCVLQDPVVCFKDADFLQSQVLNLMPTSNLVFLDWMLSGRSSLSESWSFQRYINRVEVHLLGEIILREVVELEDSPHKTVADSMEGFQVCGMCIVLGEHVQSLSQSLLHKYGQKMDLGQRRNKELVVSVSRMSYTVKGQTLVGCYLRFLASTVSQASSVIDDITSPLLPILGSDPFQNKV